MVSSQHLELTTSVTSTHIPRITPAHHSEQHRHQQPHQEIGEGQVAMGGKVLEEDEWDVEEVVGGKE